jgi:chromatin remodeling complex protein RSC6
MAKTNSAFMKPLKVSPELSVIVGKGPMPRSEVVKNFGYILRRISFRTQKTSATLMPMKT